MTRIAGAFLVVVALAGAPLSAVQTKLVDDVIRMSRAGVSDETIVAFVQNLGDRPAVTADEIIAMKTAGVSDLVIQVMVQPQQAPRAPSAGDPRAGNGPVPQAPPPPDAVLAEGGGCAVFEPPIPAFNEPPYPSWLWDPNWFQPTLDAKGGSNPTQQHGDTPRPIRDGVTTAIAQALGARQADRDGSRGDRDGRDSDRRDRSERGIEDRDPGSRGRGMSRH